MSIYIMPILLIILLIYSQIKKTDTMNSFSKGAKKAIGLIINLFPFLITIFLMLTLMEVSGLSKVIADFLSPMLEKLGVPKELSMLIVLKPFSGGGSLAKLTELYAEFGADSYISRSASVIMASSDTLLYITAIYLSKSNVKKLLYTLPIGFFVSLLSSVIACGICRVL